MPSFNEAVVFVTGANGGIGCHFVQDALARGASNVYATARSPRKMDPADLVRAVMDAVEAGEYEVPADETSVRLKAGLSASIEAIYPQLAHNADDRYSS